MSAGEFLDTTAEFFCSPIWQRLGKVFRDLQEDRNDN